MTIGHGIVNEVYWPTVGDPQVRDLGFLVAGPGFWQEIKLLPGWTITTPAAGVPVPTVVHTGTGWTLTVEVVADPDRDAALLRWDLQGSGVRLYPLLAPRLEVHQETGAADQGNVGADNTAWVGAGSVLLAERPSAALCLAAAPAFARASAGYVGISDGWQDFNRNGAMTWTYASAGPGNVALMGECATSSGVLALAFAADATGAQILAAESLAAGIDAARSECVAGWQGWTAGLSIPPSRPGDPPGLADALVRSAAVLRAHEDRTYTGAIVASLSVPWGDSRGDLSGYHLVWPRDATESGLALLALGQVGDVTRLLTYLLATQQPDGHWGQNFFPDGVGFWSGIQLDETALPVMLAAKLSDGGHPLPAGTDDMVRAALGYLVNHGPLTPEDRWEENPGGSPFTLGVIVAALVAGAALLTRPGSTSPLTAAEAGYVLALADNWNERIESWTYVTGTSLDARYGVAGHYVRIGPPPADVAGVPWGPRGFVPLANQPPGAPQVPAALLTGMEFLYLPRLGLRRPGDQRLIDTVTVVEGEVGQNVPTGRAYHRYEDDGYGETDSGDPYTGVGRGRLWPLLAGERGHFEVLSGRPPTEQLAAFVAMTGTGGLIPEQIWDAADLPARGLIEGRPTGSAMPLVWAHAELVKLTATRQTGRPAEQLDAVVARYGTTTPATGPWNWRDATDAQTTAGGTDVILRGRDLVVDDGRAFTLHWGHDGWRQVSDRTATPLGFGRYGATLRGEDSVAFATVEFTRQYSDGAWEGRDHQVVLSASPPSQLPSSRPARPSGGSHGRS